ncbi:MAG: trigger factor [Propionibacteriaceae bacterium]|jgi:trigger factor|nr:trigger factor [Propionibacteriaceae bacterium]
MPSTIEKLSATRVKLTIEIPFAELQPLIQKTYAEVAQQINIPGFRKGKVPAAIIDQRLGKGYVLQEAINEALSPAYSQALEEHEVVPLAQPDIEITKLEEGELVEFTAEVDIRPEILLPDFSKLTAEVEVLTNVKAEVDARVDTLRQRFATSKEVKRAAKEGDLTTINLVAKIGGEVIDGGISQDVSYKVGDENMIAGLESAVIGLKAGESAEFTTTLAGGSHEGEEAEIEVTVTKVQEQQLPKVDDEFAQLVSQFDTVAEMREDIEKNVREGARYAQLQQGRDRLVEALLEATEVELPEGVIAADVEDRKSSILAQLQQAGMTLASYLERTGSKETEEEFYAEMEASARRALKTQLILDAIADANDIGVTEEDLASMLMQRAMENGTSPEEEAKHMTEHGHFHEWAGQIRRNKAVEVIVAKAKVTDAKGKKVDITISAPSAADDE